MEMHRYKIDNLRAWKISKNRKPLILRGARQVGKTWLMKEFGRRFYKKTIYINFDNPDNLKDLFKTDFDVSRIITTLEVFDGNKIDPNNTLIIFDEILSVERGLKSLEYFYKDAPQYHIIAATSLLGMGLKDKESIPLKNVQFLTLRPMSFYEFLECTIDNKLLLEQLKNRNWGVLSMFHDKLIETLKYYLFIGGMPMAVKKYIEHKDLRAVRDVQKNIIMACKSDIKKYKPSSCTLRVEDVWQTIPKQLTKENKKFTYSLIRSRGRSKKIEVDIQWLLHSGLLLRNNDIADPSLPINANNESGSFKLYLSDVGLLGAFLNLDAKTIIERNSLFTYSKGALTEQYIMQELAFNERLRYAYWSNPNPSGLAKLDFVIQVSDNIVPIEVNVDNNVRSKSLFVYRDKYNPKLAIRASLKNYSFKNEILSLPLYAIEDVCKYCNK